MILITAVAFIINIPQMVGTRSVLPFDYGAQTFGNIVPQSEIIRQVDICCEIAFKRTQFTIWNDLWGKRTGTKPNLDRLDGFCTKVF